MLSSTFAVEENGTELFGYPDSPEFKADLSRYIQNFGMKFRQMSAPFALSSRTFGRFGRMEIAL